MSQIKLKVTDIQELTANIKMFEFKSADSGHLPSWEAGSHIDFQIDEHMRRSYSLANRPGDTERYVTAILREENGGGGSKYMHDNVSVGDELIIAEPPTNHFPLNEKANKHLLLGGGIGITPLLAMGYRLKDMDADFHLHYCTKSKEETAFYDEIVEVFGTDGVTFHHDGGNPANGIKLSDVLKAPGDGAHLYICGPTGLLNAAREAASHWPDGSVHFELFAPSANTQEWQNEAFEISLSRHKKVLTVPADKSILEVVREAGVDVESSCENGICNTCRTGLLGGTAEHRDEVLSDQEKADQSVIMICTSRAKKGETLILDL